MGGHKQLLGVAGAVAGALAVGVVSILPFTLAVRVAGDLLSGTQSETASADLITQATTVLVMVVVMVALWWAVVWWAQRSTDSPVNLTWGLSGIALVVPALVYGLVQ